MSRNPSDSGSDGQMSLGGDASDGNEVQLVRRKRTRVLMTHVQQTSLTKLWKEVSFFKKEIRSRSRPDAVFGG